MTTVAETLAQTLHDAGVQHVFGLPGGENVEVLEAMRQAGIEFILVHHETSAVFMADAYARLTRKPGVVLTTLGPGATNVVAGVAHAYLDRAPVLVITAQAPDSVRPLHTHQFVDLRVLYAPITKGSIPLRPQGAQTTVQAALALTTSGRPGPVHLQVSNEDAGQIALPGEAPIESSLPQAVQSGNMAAAHNVLAHSHRPVIVSGLGLEPEGAYEALRVLAEAANAPVITTPKGKGNLPEDHPLSAGAVGMTRTDPAYEILDEADCVIAVGFDVVELVKPWDTAAPLIWVASWPNEDPTLTAQAEPIGTLEPALTALADAVFTTSPAWGAQRVAHLREKLASSSLPSPKPGRVLPQLVFDSLRQNTPRDAIMITDVGSHKLLAALMWPAYTPNSFMQSNGLSCMGFGLPAAIGAQLAAPERTVICATGDAGLVMAMGELGVASRLHTPIIIVVFNDEALDLIRSQQIRAGKRAYGTEFTNPDFIEIAHAYGIDAHRVTGAEECVQAAKSAVAARRLTLIEAMIDPISYPTTPASSAGRR